jgi:hypothetical protein
LKYPEGFNTVRMNRKQTPEKPRPTSKAFRSVAIAPPDRALAQVRRRLAITLGLVAVSLLFAGFVWADWYYGLPEGAKAKFVGRQSCLQCHQPQHDAWHGSHHDLAMDRATDESVLGDFQNAELTHQADVACPPR